MKKIAQMMCDYTTNDEIVKGWKKYLDKLVILSHKDTPDPEIPMIMSANPLGMNRRWMAKKLPFFATNRQYLGSWLLQGRDSHRVSVNSFACTKLGSIPYSRWNLLGIEKQPWAVKEVKNVLIATSKKSQRIFTGEDQMVWANRIKDQLELEGAKVKIRPKLGKRKSQFFGEPSKNLSGLFGEHGDLEWADLVISYSSAITAEAFWYGKKAISLGVCPTWIACDNTLDRWKDPLEPVNRDIWHEHMAWIQFKKEEWYNGSAQEMTVFYQGWPTEVPNTNNRLKL